jgi:hypothetical protein
MATALTLVNGVLRRLRENQVTGFSAPYTALILDFVNETKQEVEDAWRWTAMRQTISIDTVPGTQLYTLTGAGQRFQFQDRLKRMFNSTSADEIFPLGGSEIEQYKWMASQTNALPSYYRMIGTDGTDMKFELFPIPDAVYTLKIPVCVPSLDFVLPEDTTNAPSLPIILGSWARAISERGEDQGFKTTDQYVLYQNALSYAIGLDVARVADETTWTVS